MAASASASPGVFTPGLACPRRRISESSWMAFMSAPMVSRRTAKRGKFFASKLVDESTLRHLQTMGKGWRPWPFPFSCKIWCNDNMVQYAMPRADTVSLSTLIFPTWL